MKLQAVLVLFCLMKTGFALPVQIGIIASNSNEVLRLNGLTLLGQPQLVLQQQQPDVLLTPNVLNLNPQIPGPFGPQGPQLMIPAQGNQLTPVLLPNGQQEQGRANRNSRFGPQGAQNTMQMFSQFQYPYGFPQFPRQQGFPYFIPSYGFPQPRNPAVLQPNNGQVVTQQTFDITTQRPQLPLQQATLPKVQTENTWLLGTQKETTTTTPLNRGDTSGPGVDDGNPKFPFLFEP